jgi:hypothetical protein
MRSGEFYVPNGIFFVKDSEKFPVPMPDVGGIFAANKTSIAVLAKHEQDGKCRISLGRIESVALQRPADFYQTIDVPTRRLIVILVPRVEILSMPVANDRVAVSIWMNDPVYADLVTIGIEQF